MSPYLRGFATLLFAVASRGAPGQAPTFPHERHTHVFPVCEGCHAGIVTGDSARMFPVAGDCERCHDGERQRTIAWRGRTPRITILRFSHGTHREILSGRSDTASCQACHAVPGATERLAVSGPNPARCVRCHQNSAREHLAPDAACRTCHLPLPAQPRLTRERIAGFPKPGWHEGTAFASQHGRIPVTQRSSCAICHARESCERCHANAPAVPLIVALGRDARVAQLVRDRPPAYEPPDSHRRTTWRLTHGSDAMPSAKACANCHTQASCVTCHREGTGSARVAVNTLPGPGVRRGLGVDPSRTAGPVHDADIVVRHGTAAASGKLHCGQCHAERTCAACHAGQDARLVHAPNFVERHAVDVFASASDCQSCHNTERFCRDCHSRSGIASSGRMNAAFHTGLPTWVLSHGQAARTGLESCASCHRQADCTRCHSAAGGWGVNPHRAGYPANALAARNASSCAWCHLGAAPRGSR